MAMVLGDIKIDWLEGGTFELDGGTMFGPVPRVLWAKKMPPTPDNYLSFRNSPMLLRTPGANVIIETGLGNKLTDKQLKIFRVGRQWDLPGSLAALGLGVQDIDMVILTHCDFDHAGGVVMKKDDGSLALTFPRARHIVQSLEWQDAMHPNKRAASSYWTENLNTLRDSERLEVVEGDAEVAEGISVMLTGGHTRGHQAVAVHSKGQHALHMGDLLPSSAHHNPLWVMSYDNYPLEVIEQRERFYAMAHERKAWLLMYHDPKYNACRFDNRGNVTDSLEA